MTLISSLYLFTPRSRLCWLSLSFPDGSRPPRSSICSPPPDAIDLSTPFVRETIASAPCSQEFAAAARSRNNSAVHTRATSTPRDRWHRAFRVPAGPTTLSPAHCRLLPDRRPIHRRTRRYTRPTSHLDLSLSPACAALPTAGSSQFRTDKSAPAIAVHNASSHE